jgi:hypothetical protein
MREARIRSCSSVGGREEGIGSAMLANRGSVAF